MRSQTNLHMIATNRTLGMAAVAEALAHWIGALAQRLEDRRAMRSLLGMSEHELKDIGVTRADLEREAMKPLFRRAGG